MSGAQPQPHAQQEGESRQQQPQQTGTSLPLPPQAKSPVTLPPHAQTPPPTAPPQAQPQPQPQPQPEPHRPPQAYPAPPVTPPSAPPVTPPPVGGAASGHGYGQGQGQGAYGEHAAAHSGTGPESGDGGMGIDTGTTVLGRTAAPAAPAAAGAVRRPRTGARTVPQTRKARLRVAKADPWSVMKVSFLLSIALGVCTVVAVGVLWTVMNAMGVFTAVSDTLGEATQSGSGGGFDIESFLSLPRVLGFTTLIALIDVVLATALATLGAFIYNLSAGFVGGVELTLAEDE